MIRTLVKRLPRLAAGACAAALLAGAAAAAEPENDYPTEARADYIFGCMAANGQSRESLSRCSCSLDALAALLPYDKYVPLSYKLFEIAVTEGWRNKLVTDVIPGEVEVYGSLDNVIASPEKRRVVLVYMIGGLTYSEQAYMKKLADQLNVELLVATSHIIKSTDLTEQFIKTQPPAPEAEHAEPE